MKKLSAASLILVLLALLPGCDGRADTQPPPYQNPYVAAPPGETIWIESSEVNLPPKQVHVINKTLEDIWVFVDDEWNQIVYARRNVRSSIPIGGNASVTWSQLGIGDYLSMHFLLVDISDTLTHTLEFRNEQGDVISALEFKKDEFSINPPTITIPVSPPLQIINRTGMAATVFFNNELIDTLNPNETFSIGTIAQPMDISSSVSEYQISVRDEGGNPIFTQIYSWQELDRIGWTVTITASTQEVLQAAEEYLRMATAFLGQDNYSEASKTVAKTQYIEPDTADFHTRRGDLYIKLNEIESATADYERAVDLEPTVERQLMLAKLYRYSAFFVTSDEFEKAITLLDNTIQLAPQSAEAYIARSWFYRERGFSEIREHAGSFEALAPEYKADYAQSLEDVSRAIKIDPTAENYAARAIVHIDMGEYKKAIADYSEAILLEPNKGLYFMRGKVHYVRGKYDRAISDFTIALELDSQATLVKFNIALAHTGLGDHQEALNALNEVIRVMPDEADYYIFRSVVYVALGQPNEARLDYYKAVDLKPDIETYSEKTFPVPEMVYFPQWAKLPETLSGVQKALGIIN
jgi:tetratricopeptide (TPR) repeat protein